MFLTMAMVLACAAQLTAQTNKISDKEIVGVWMMESMQWEGEKKVVCGKASGYTQFKFYGADGEYACAEIALTKDGKCVVMPHEYGTYTFKNGVYSEMGRPAVRPSDMVLTDKTHFRGRWKNRNDFWVKHPQMPDKVVRYIVDRCKTKETPSDVQQLIKQSMFK